MTTIPNSGTKVCICCRIEKNVLAFSVKRAQPDQLNPQCRDCVSEGNKRRYRQHHQIGRREETRARFGKNPYAQE